MSCSYLLHGCDVIQIFKLCIEERVEKSIYDPSTQSCQFLKHATQMSAREVLPMKVINMFSYNIFVFSQIMTK